VVDVGRLQKAQGVLSELYGVSVAEAPHRTGVIPAGEVEDRARLAAREHRLWRLLDETPHPAALVGLEVRAHDVGEALGVQDLGHGIAHLSYIGCIPVWIRAGRSSSIRNWLTLMPNSGSNALMR
jgi:hypothetical protein